MVRISVPLDQKSNDKGEDKKEMEAKLFVFDKDGTLLSHDHFVPIMKKRIELINAHYKLTDADIEHLSRVLGFDPTNEQILPSGTMFIARADTQLLVEAFLGELGYRGPELRKFVTAMFEEADEKVELDKYIKPISGVSELLAKLKDQGAIIAIATHDSTQAAKNQLKIAQLEKHIDLIIGLDYAKNILHKPSPSMLQAACDKFQLTPDTAVVVGDSVNDVLMGIRGGAGMSIGVLTGVDNAENFKEFDALIDSVTSIEIIG